MALLVSMMAELSLERITVSSGAYFPGGYFSGTAPTFILAL
jgi:hypothetical protein